MDGVTVALLVIAGLLLIAVVVLLRRPGHGDAAGLLQHQLVELRDRLDRVAGAQAAVPRELAEGRAEQSAALSRQFAELSGAITAQLQAAQHTVGRGLADTGQAVADLRDRLGRLAEATKRLESLGEHVAEVHDLLSVPKLRGTVGELMLEELLRQVFPESLYRMQHTFPGGERVDAVLTIGGRLVPVDSKFPLEACQRMLAAEGEQRGRERRAFQRGVRARIDEIAERYIQPSQGTYDFALMYIPAERVYYEAVIRDENLDGDDSVMAYAMARRVVPVSPNTFYAYLSAVLHGLRGLRVAERAREILAALGALEVEFERFRRSHELVGRHLDNAAKQYLEADRHIGRIADRFRDVTGPRRGNGDPSPGLEPGFEPPSGGRTLNLE